MGSLYSLKLKLTTEQINTSEVVLYYRREKQSGKVVCPLGQMPKSRIIDVRRM